MCIRDRYRDDLVHLGRVVGGWPHVLANPLDQVRTAGATGVDRALRVGADDLDPAALAVGRDLAQVPAGAGDRAAGADASDEVGDLALGVSPDLWTGRQVVALSLIHIGVPVSYTHLRAHETVLD